MSLMTMRHIYVSTACQHDLHDRCRMTCKFCNDVCKCDCHLIKAGHQPVQVTS